MELWILTAYNEIEDGEEVFGVFDSREKAEDARNELEGSEEKSVCQVQISTMNLNRLYLN